MKHHCQSLWFAGYEEYSRNLSQTITPKIYRWPRGSAERSNAMKRIRLVLGAILPCLVLLGGFSTASVSSSGRNNCKDRCNDHYKIAKDACKAIPLNRARKVCEDSAKSAKNECKRRCR